MPDCMNFPDNIMDFIDDYSFEDSNHIYTNGSKLIQSFRVKQAIEHYFREREPVAPTQEQSQRLPEDIEYYCGNCGAMVGIYDKSWNHWDLTMEYCYKCGRKVKWNDR